MEYLKKVAAVVGVGQGLAPGFPYALDEQIASEAELLTTGGIWSIHKAHNVKAKSDAATVFIADISKSSTAAAVARNAMKRLRTLRHPRILKLLDSVEVDGKVYLATEPVSPISQQWTELIQSQDWLLWVLFCIVDGLKFLNEEVKMIHGNIRRSALFLTASGELRLAGFELAAGPNDTEMFFTNPGRYLRGANVQEWPSDVIGASVQTVRSVPSYSIDAWMLASLIRGLACDALPAPLVAWSRDVLGADPARRHSSSLLLEPSVCSRVFTSPLITVDNLVTSLSASDEVERDRIFVKIQQLLSKIPEAYLASKLLPTAILLLQIKPSLEGIRMVLRSVQILTDEAAFQASIAPFIVWLFSLPDRAIRLLLLDSLEGMLELLQERTVQDSIFGHFCSGFADAMPEIREKSLKCSVLMAPKLSSRQLNTDLPRLYGRLQVDEQPGIRVNAIICIGKVAALMEEAGRQKVLLGAFGKALQDPFPPTRSAAIMALMATGTSFSDEALARSILPQLCASLVDRDPSISSQAFAAMRLMMDRLEASQAAARRAEPTDAAAPSPTITKKASEWGSWGLGAITDQVSKLHTKLASSKEPSKPTSPVAESVEPPPARKTAMKLAKKTPELDLEPKQEEGSLNIQSLSLHDGWLDGSEELDPWTNTT